ncbi:hypothetical protein GCM10027082_24340 [Comamonas humi]
MTGEMFTLPSGAIIKVGTLIAGTQDDWNCSYQSKHQDHAVTLRGDFLRKYGDRW